MNEAIGIMAGICTTVSLVPQVIKTLKTKSAKDVSLLMFVIFSMGVLLWLVYGFIINSISMIVANCVTFVLAAIILVAKVKYR
ncbi:MAG: SemiSWEET transporter [Candidatus Gracilibacteria bacterium]